MKLKIDNNIDKDLIPRFWFCLLFTFPFFVRRIDPSIQCLLATIVLAVGNWSFFQKAWQQKVSTYTLFSLSVGILYIYSLFEGLFSAAPVLYYGMVASVTMVILLEQLCEQHIRTKASLSLTKLVQRAPTKAHKLLIDGRSEEIEVADLKNGDTIRLGADDIVPVDGVIFSGDCDVEESLISGDTKLVHKVLGSTVYAASKTIKGSCLVRAVRTGKDTFYAQMQEIVNQSIVTPSSMQEIIDKIAFAQIIGAIVLSIILFLFWTLFSGLANAVLVVSALCISICPCAILLASSVVKKISLREAARQGIVIRSVKAFENLAACDILVANKNGTLTVGKPSIVSVDPSEGVVADELLLIAASLEAKSHHPYAVCIVEKAAAIDHTLFKVEELQEVPGLGIKGKIDETLCLIGDEKLMQGIDLGFHKMRAEDMRKQGYIVLFCAKGQKLLGVIVLSDPIRRGVKETLKSFKEEGIGLFCLSGDRRITVVQLVNALGFDRFQAEAPATQKILTVKKLQNEGKTVLMIADPINDAQALNQANAGVALGTRGQLLNEAWPISLLDANFTSALRLLNLSKSLQSINKQNIFISCSTTFILLIMATFGSLGPSHGAFYMMISVLVVGYNSLRLLSTK